MPCLQSVGSLRVPVLGLRLLHAENAASLIAAASGTSPFVVPPACWMPATCLAARRSGFHARNVSPAVGPDEFMQNIYYECIHAYAGTSSKSLKIAELGFLVKGTRGPSALPNPEQAGQAL